MAKLLLAEDDQAISMLERDYLEMEGYEITAVDKRTGRHHRGAEGGV